MKNLEDDEYVVAEGDAPKKQNYTHFTIFHNQSSSIMQTKQPAVYMLSNKKGGVLYIGVTSNLTKRVYQHQTHQADGFSKKYNLNNLIYFELHSTMVDAIYREKQLKHWNREWKIKLIEKMNPDWLDLSQSII